jgi:hypothetical protein
MMLKSGGCGWLGHGKLLLLLLLLLLKGVISSAA